MQVQFVAHFNTAFGPAPTAVNIWYVSYSWNAINPKVLQLNAYRKTRRQCIPYRDAVAAAVWWVSFASCPCNACSGTRHESLVNSVRSSRRAGPSSVRPDVGSPRSRCAACEAVSHWALSLCASSSSSDHDVTPTSRHATSRDATSYFRFRSPVSFRRRRCCLCCSCVVSS